MIVVVFLIVDVYVVVLVIVDLVLMFIVDVDVDDDPDIDCCFYQTLTTSLFAFTPTDFFIKICISPQPVKSTKSPQKVREFNIKT